MFALYLTHSKKITLLYFQKQLSQKTKDKKIEESNRKIKSYHTGIKKCILGKIHHLQVVA